MAYFQWLNTGCPSGQCLEHWLAAEREWIERCYVPNRQLVLVKERGTSVAQATPVDESRDAKTPCQIA
jgi:hypothetical protein